MNAEIDFLAMWRAYFLRGDTSRLDAAVDQVFWDNYAPHYDARTAASGSYTQTLNALLELVRPTDTVLDVGAGTGRFALPLSYVVRQVTALDHAPAMLKILRAKMEQDGIRNIRIVQAAWEAGDIEMHDIVLAAWSLYRQLNLAHTLQKLVDATRRTLVIVAGDDFSPPHRALFEEIWGRDGEPDVPACLYLLGALWQIGVRADLHVVYESRKYHGATPVAIATQLAPTTAAAQDVERLAAGLTPWLEQQNDQWRYEIRFPVSLLIWQRLN